MQIAKNEEIGVSIDTTTSRNQVNVYTNEESEQTNTQTESCVGHRPISLNFHTES